MPFSVTPRVARLMLTFTGATPQLQAALAEKSMALIPQPPDWVLTVAGGEAPAPAEAQKPAPQPKPDRPRTQ